MAPKCVTIITINFNSNNDTFELIESILNSDYNPSCISIIIVDNFSEFNDFLILSDKLKAIPIALHIFEPTFESERDSSPYALKKWEEKIYLKKTYVKNEGELDVTLVRTARNEGFSAGNNIGLKFCKESDAVLVINNDMTLARHTIAHMMKDYENGAMVVTGPILYYDKKDELWYAGGEIRFEPMIRGRHLKKGQKLDQLVGMKRKFTEFVSGAFLLVDKGLIEKKGLFHEAFFFGEEDAEFSWRFKKSGIKIHFNLKAISWHKVGRSRGAQRSEFLKSIHWHSKVYLAHLTKNGLSRAVWLIMFFTYALIQDLWGQASGKKIMFKNLTLLLSAWRESKKLKMEDFSTRRSECYQVHRA